MARIAVIDDHEPIRTLLVEVLAEGGHVPIALEGPGDLVASLVGTLPDLVLLDLRLGPWGDGLILAGAIRREPALARTPLVLMSAAPELLARRAPDLEALHWRMVDKPFDLDKLLSLIAAELDGVKASDWAASPGAARHQLPVDRAGTEQGSAW